MVNKLTFNERKYNTTIKQPHLELIDYRELDKFGVFIDSKYGLFEGTYHKVLAGVKMHPNRASDGRKFTFEQAAKSLNDKFKHLTLLNYTEGKNVCTVLDEAYGEFEGVYISIRAGGTIHPSRKTISLKNGYEKGKDKRIQTCMDKYGVQHVTQVETIKDKMKNTLMSNYGVVCPMKNVDIKEKFIETLNDKRGSESHTLIAQQHNISQTMASKLIRDYGEVPENYEKQKFTIETVVENILKLNNIKYSKGINVCRKRPDITIDDKKLIIECDGLRWHSDGAHKYMSKDYHKIKQTIYTSNGFTSLFFREDEIKSKKIFIIESIIKNKLGLSNKIFARKCKIVDLQINEVNKFFIDNHLMGKGKGRAFGLLYDGELVAAIQVVKKGTGLDVSRFATKLNTSVVGGLSKLLKQVERVLKPEFIQSFVDLRYGTGISLETLGYTRKSEYLSFKWTDFKTTYHRMMFKGNTGYEKGFYKIWDCGQAKYVKYL